MIMTKPIFQRSSLLLGDDCMERLARCRVIVFGVGGVGSWCVEALARSGIGHITMVDSDCVATSNINRQLPALTTTVGRPKADVMLERLTQINPDIEAVAIKKFYSTETAGEFDLDNYDYVIDAIDTLDCKARLIQHALSCRCVLFSSMGAALKMHITDISTANFDKVQGCPLARALRQKFRREGSMPKRKFKCVYSPELLKNRQAETASAEGGPAAEAKSHSRSNGTLVHAVATFGLMLAGLVVEAEYSKA
ncbi:MAG: ThiF family adenylyltransferase [Muribaculaceae bacterium]|nr:ThiF family adenylyltransferase [Muribaculaceae bacterium]